MFPRQQGVVSGRTPAIRRCRACEIAREVLQHAQVTIKQVPVVCGALRASASPSASSRRCESGRSSAQQRAHDTKTGATHRRPHLPQSSPVDRVLHWPWTTGYRPRTSVDRRTRSSRSTWRRLQHTQAAIEERQKKCCWGTRWRRRWWAAASRLRRSRSRVARGVRAVAPNERMSHPRCPKVEGSPAEFLTKR